jgi:hypothetical protein
VDDWRAADVDLAVSEVDEGLSGGEHLLGLAGLERGAQQADTDRDVLILERVLVGEGVLFVE